VHYFAACIMLLADILLLRSGAAEFFRHGLGAQASTIAGIVKLGVLLAWRAAGDLRIRVKVFNFRAVTILTKTDGRAYSIVRRNRPTVR